MLGTIARSIGVDIITEGAASFLDKQTDVDQKQERLNELLIQINSAIEFAKAREPIQNIWLCKWLEDLQKAARDGEKVRSEFKEQTFSGNTTMNPLRVTVRLYQRSKIVTRLNDALTRLERKASGCKEFLQRLRYEFKERRHQTYIEKVGKLEKKVRRLRNCLRSLKSDSKFKNHNKTKLLQKPRRPDTTKLLGLHNENHGKTENIKDELSELEIQVQDDVLDLAICENHKKTKLPHRQKRTAAIISQTELNNWNHSDTDNMKDKISEQEIAQDEHVSIKKVAKFGKWDCVEWEGDYTVIFNKCRDEQRSDSATNNLKPLPTVHAKASKSENNEHKKNFIRRFFGLFRCIFPVLSSSTATQN